MTKKQFDTYRFYKKTQVKVFGEWHTITDVLFRDYQIWAFGCERAITPEQIEDIKG